MKCPRCKKEIPPSLIIMGLCYDCSPLTSTDVRNYFELNTKNKCEVCKHNNPDDKNIFCLNCVEYRNDIYKGD